MPVVDLVFLSQFFLQHVGIVIALDLAEYLQLSRHADAFFFRLAASSFLTADSHIVIDWTVDPVQRLVPPVKHCLIIHHGLCNKLGTCLGTPALLSVVFRQYRCFRLLMCHLLNLV